MQYLIQCMSGEECDVHVSCMLSCKLQFVCQAFMMFPYIWDLLSSTNMGSYPSRKLCRNISFSVFLSFEDRSLTLRYRVRSKPASMGLLGLHHLYFSCILVGLLEGPRVEEAILATSGHSNLLDEKYLLCDY